MPNDHELHEAAKRILQFYNARAGHIGIAAEKMAVDYARTLTELEQSERKLRAAASRGYLRTGL